MAQPPKRNFICTTSIAEMDNFLARYFLCSSNSLFQHLLGFDYIYSKLWLTRQLDFYKILDNVSVRRIQNNAQRGA